MRYSLAYLNKLQWRYNMMIFRLKRDSRKVMLLNLLPTPKMMICQKWEALRENLKRNLTRIMRWRKLWRNTPARLRICKVILAQKMEKLPNWKYSSHKWRSHQLAMRYLTWKIVLPPPKKRKHSDVSSPASDLSFSSFGLGHLDHVRGHSPMVQPAIDDAGVSSLPTPTNH